MPSPLPTDYDWSSTNYPQGPFGTEDIPGSQTVLGNLSGAGALGTDGILNFLSGISGGKLDLSNLNRFAGGIGSLLGESGFDMQESIKQLNKMSKKTTKQINKRIENIYPELTGLKGSEARKKAYQEFNETIKQLTKRGRKDIDIDPQLGAQYDRLKSRVDDIQNQYSLANRLGGYEKLALDPAVVSMDVGSLRKAADWTAPEIASQYGTLMDYSGPQASRFIYGGSNTADAIGRYYNTSGDVAGLMNYGRVA